MARLAREQALYHLGHVGHAAGGLESIAAAWTGAGTATLRLSLPEFIANITAGFARGGRVPHCGEAGRALLSGAVAHDCPEPYRPQRPAYRYAGEDSAEVQLNFGLPIFVDTGDDSVAPDIVRTGWWEP